MPKDTVFVTGASGFIATWIIKQLIEDGYRVLGSVRSEAKGDHIAKFYSPETFDYVIIKSLDDQAAFDTAFEKHPEIKYALHMASPVQMESENPIEELVKPAIDGVLSILKAAKKYGKNVKKLVFTSSFVTMMQKIETPDIVYTENTWSDLKVSDISPEIFSSGYIVSKGEAERKFWEFIKTETVPFSVSTILVPYAMGPYPDGFVSSPAELHSSASYLYYYYKSVDNFDSMKPESTLKAPVLDVRDITKFHILAMTNPALDNKRVLPTKRFTTEYDLIRGFKALNEGTDKECDFDKVSAPVPKIDSSATSNLIGEFKYIPIEQTLKDAKTFFDKLDSHA